MVVYLMARLGWCCCGCAVVVVSLNFELSFLNFFPLLLRFLVTSSFSSFCLRFAFPVSMDYKLLLFSLSELFIFECDDLEDEHLLEWIMSIGEPSIFGIHKLKDRGNSYFKEGNFSLAVSLYKFALNLFCLLDFPPSHDHHSPSSLALSLVLNLAACELKLSHYNQVCCYCNLVLNFDPCNVKALYRRGLAFSQTNLLTDALKDFEHALQLDPNNKDANRELVAVVDRLVMNPNGKRIASPFDPLGFSNMGKKPLFSNALIDKCDVASCSSVQMVDKAVGIVADNNQDAVSSSPDSIMDLDEFGEAEPPLLAEAKCDTPGTSSSSPTNFSFSNKKRAHNTLNLSSQRYEDLLQGKDLEFFHPRSMSFMRVRPLIPKTIQTGTPLDEFSGQAEVPITSPLSKEQVQHQVVLKSDKVVQEDAVFQIDKKKRISSGSAQVSKVSVVQFQFVAIKENMTKSFGRKAHDVHHRNRVTQESVLLKRRFSVSIGFSHSHCRYTKNDAAAMQLKRKEPDLFHFDDLYHPPFKKWRLNVSVLFHALLIPLVVCLVV